MLCDGFYAARTRSDRTNSCFFDLKAEHLILPEEVSFKKSIQFQAAVYTQG